MWLVDLAERRILVSRPAEPVDVPHDDQLTGRGPDGRTVRLDNPHLLRDVALVRSRPDG